MAVTPFEMASAKGRDDTLFPAPKKPPVPILSNYLLLKNNMYSKAFCEVGSDGHSGISITEAGYVGFFAPNLGAPNPYTYFAVISDSFASNHNKTAKFKIKEFYKADHKLVNVVAEYIYNVSEQKISSGEFVFTAAACEELK